MTTYSFDEYPDSDVEFDPTEDKLSIWSGSAGYVRLIELADGSGVTIVRDDKQLTLLGATLESLNEFNVVFSDGTKLANACLANNFSTELTGTEYNDQLIGGPAGRAIESVSVPVDGGPSGVQAVAAAVSADGRLVVFESNASQPNGDIWMKDLATDEVSLVSTTSGGAPGNQGSHAAMVAGDGHSVVFESSATNLVSSDTNGVSDIYVKNLVTGELTRVSTGSDGHQGTGGGSSGASTSHDGRFVAFESLATNLVTGDVNSASDIFVKDTVTGTLTLVSTSTSGVKGNAGSSGLGSRDASISADGKFVVFTSWSSNLVAGDTDGTADVFVKNLTTGQLTCVSTDVLGNQVGGDSKLASISASGRYVVFESSSSLMGDNQNGAGSIYVRDLWTGQLSRVKGEGTSTSSGVSISGDGRYVAFVSETSLVDGDTNGQADVYVKDMQTGSVALVSLNGLGEVGNGGSLAPRISLDGSTIVFSTDASNLVPGDTDEATSTMVVSNPLFATTLSGGWGDDIYIVTSSSDRIVEVMETGGGGTSDRVQTHLSYVLPDNVEILELTGTESINGTGNAGHNFLYGNAAGNVLVGGAGIDRLDGGLGADTLVGGTDIDFYYVDDAGDVVVELADEGIDWVTSTISYTLSAEVEKLTLKQVATALDATGNALNNTLVGNWNANVLDGKAGADTMEGGAGDDIYVVDNVGDLVVEGSDLVGDDWGTDLVRSSISYTLPTFVDNLTLTGAAALDGTGNSLNNALTGNSANNALAGGAGDDTLNGGAGADTLTGSIGNDTFVVDNVADQVVELASEGTDTVRSSISWTLQSTLENLTLTGSAAIDGHGNAGANVMLGNGAANLLNGGVGNDTMTGGAGNDIYVVDAAGDKTLEVAAGGTDLVQSSITFTLQAQVENLTLTGASAIDGTGNSLANLIVGNAANNVLNGGAGGDTLVGGAGNDTYLVDNTGDRTDELSGEGVDLVQASVSWALSSEVENLTLTGSASIQGIGNGLNNVLTGNSGNNHLDGGQGSDTLAGGAGNDTYVVDTAGDLVVEAAGGGTDTVLSLVSWTLGTEFENLTLSGSGSTQAIGNSLNNAVTGNSGNNYLNGGLGSDTLAGGAGNDTYVIDTAGDRVIEAAGGGTDSVQSFVSWTLGADVENLTLAGSGANRGTGNNLANTITGNSAANVLDGGAGADKLIGGAGNDTYVVDHSADSVVEAAGGGIDAVQSSISWTLGAEVEHLTLVGSGSIQGIGNALNNALTGNGGNNYLNGNLGSDTLAGGTGNDTYVVDSTTDQVIEAASGGTDVVQSFVSWTLGAEVEHLTLAGSASIQGIGNSLNNALTGNAGNNYLNGGLGNDTLTGGGGNDTYVVDTAGDQVIEAAGGGVDTVQAFATWSLSADVENLTLLGSGSIQGFGNALNNSLTGNAGSNLLDGGLGADTLTGGAGNDTYVVDSTGDQLIESAGGGTDTVQSFVSWTLATEFENLTLEGFGSIQGIGNSLNNALTGNSGSNYLNGGLGGDTLTGGGGNDTYVVDTTSDQVVEFTGGGSDTVQSFVSWTLGADVENLTLAGSSSIQGIGNVLDNTLTGNSGSNVIDGGQGADTLTGGAGNDTFDFTSALASDVITDFLSGSDKFRLGQAAARVGDGDTVVEGAVAVNGPNGFATSAELVIIGHDIAGAITSDSAAVAIGRANSAYQTGDLRLFVVDNGSDSAVYLFQSANADAIVSANELTLVATLDNTTTTATTDYLFGP